VYLCRLQVVNFRNYRNADFKFNKGANTIIGENDSGKSNALTALRILLDDSFFYNTKRLRESDFSYSLSSKNWRGHWIIISATFGGISETDKENDICASLVVDNSENVASVSSLITNEDKDYGVVTLFIRPQKGVRKKLFDASGDADKFQKVREAIRLNDYEFYFTSKSKADFTNDDTYKCLVGDIEANSASNPEEDDSSLLGIKLAISDVQNHISLVYVDALRDVLRDMSVPRNPVRRIIEAVEGKIDPESILAVKDKIKELNSEITNISEISTIGDNLNRQLLDILGIVYSPELHLSSELSDEINSLSKFISMKPSGEDDIGLLGLGHLNMIYLALKIVEFEVCRSRELLNIMIVEEPEAHIHSHIQKTLFDNLSVTKNYTQIIMTTHSVHLAESSEISQMNILKTVRNESIAMQPIIGLNEFGKEQLGKKSLDLAKCIERYLNAKRNVLLFSKGVLLVEGDAEEILIPHMVKEAFGISLDEIGVGLINVGSTAFEYIASVFDDKRINRYCAIITDLDKQAVDESSEFYKAGAELKGKERKEKLDKLYSGNYWVKPFLAENTFEIDFVNYKDNYTYVSNAIKRIYTQAKTIKGHQDRIKNENDRNEEMFSLAKKEGKGWFATILSSELDYGIGIPTYIMDAIAFAAQETMTIKIYEKMIKYSLSCYLDDDSKKYLKEFCNRNIDEEQKQRIIQFLKTEDYSEDIVKLFIDSCERYINLLEVVEGD